jgi:parallel beta-helix repeat protein
VFIFIDNSHYNNITGNTANGNNYEGISLGDGSNNTIKGNKISNNDYGIYIETGDYNDIIDNIFYNNTLGMYIESGCDNNSIYQNFFLENGIHAEDDGTDNKWNSTSIGNYWDNWTSPDVAPNDGIVDDPYTYIGGSAGSIDYLPIAEDGAPVIVINSPTSSDVFGLNAPSFDVTITDDYLDEMWYTIDVGITNYTFIENGIINQTAWAALAEGDVTITFYAKDIIGNEASETVTVVKATAGLDPGIIITIVVVSVVGGVALAAVIYIYLKKRPSPE